MAKATKPQILSFNRILVNLYYAGSYTGQVIMNAEGEVKFDKEENSYYIKVVGDTISKAWWDDKNYLWMVNL